MASKPWDNRRELAEEALSASSNYHQLPSTYALNVQTPTRSLAAPYAPEPAQQPSTYSRPVYWDNPQPMAYPNSFWQPAQDLSLQVPESIFHPETYIGKLERKLRTLASAIVWMTRAANGLLGMVDSTMYAAWSTIMTSLAAWQRLSSLRRDYLSKWLEFFERSLENVFTAKGSRAIINSEPGKGPDPQLQYSRTRLLTASVLVASLLYLVKRTMKNSVEKAQKIPAIALYPFQAIEEGCMGLEAGEDIWIIGLPKGSDPWVLVERKTTGEKGFVPISFIKRIESKY